MLPKSSISRHVSVAKSVMERMAYDELETFDLLSSVGSELVDVGSASSTLIMWSCVLKNGASGCIISHGITD